MNYKWILFLPFVVSLCVFTSFGLSFYFQDLAIIHDFERQQVANREKTLEIAVEYLRNHLLYGDIRGARIKLMQFKGFLDFQGYRISKGGETLDQSPKFHERQNVQNYQVPIYFQNGGVQWGTVTFLYSTDSIASLKYNLQRALILKAFGLTLLILICLSVLSIVFYRSLSQLEWIILSFQRRNFQRESGLLADAFFKQFISSLRQGYQEFFRIQDELQVKSRQSMLVDVAKKVAHDIRSPLSALNIVAKSSTELSESTKELLTSATDRIAGIADELLRKSKESSKIEDPDNLTVAMLDQLVPRLVREKQIEIRSLNFDVQSGYGCFSSVNESKLKSILSNLINNSAEAGATRVSINISSNKSHCTIQIDDNGKGIKPSLLKKIGREKVTTKPDGHGIGMSSAFQALKSWGGSIEIVSQLGRGTSIKLNMLSSKVPTWFVGTLKKFDSVILVDDDDSIHQLFESQLSIPLTSYFSIKDFSESVEKSLDSLILIDNDFRGTDVKGIDLVSEYKNAVLISGDFSPSLLNRVEKIGCKLIPKECLANEKFWKLNWDQ